VGVFTARSMTFGAAFGLGRPPSPRGINRRVGLAGLAAGLTALVLALVPLGGARHDDADGDSPSPASAVPVSVQLDTHRPGRPVPPRFLGLSFEVAALAQIASYGDSGNFVNLLRSLGPGVMRFGGISADTRVAWTDRRTPRPAWASMVLTGADLRKLGRLAARSGWRVLLTVGLAHYQPAAAAREVAAAKAALGQGLAGIEIGNEPDAYAKHGLRPSPWTFRQYDAELRRYRRAIARAAPGVTLAGPGVSGSAVFRRWGAAEASARRSTLLTGHHYPLGCHSMPPPTISQLLAPGTRALERRSLHRYMSVSRARSIPFRLDEVGSVSCGGHAGISNTFASALWAAGYIAQAMAAGVSGVNFQGNPANCLGYSPVCASTSQRLASGRLGAQPAWYALLLARALVGSRPLPTRVVTAGQPNLIVRSFMGPDRTLRLMIAEDDPPGAPPARLRLRIGAGYRAATVLTLTAPSPASTSGVSVAGRSVSSDGSWHEPRQVPPIPARGGVLSLTVSPSSAALVTVSPSGATTRP
jgi:hypothetical protein